MGLRALVQVLLGMFVFAFAVLLLTANSDADGTLWAEVGGTRVGAPTLFLGVFLALAALVAVSRAGRSRSPAHVDDAASIRSECSQCGWTDWAPTIEEAKRLGRQHLAAAHGGATPPPPPGEPSE